MKIEEIDRLEKLEKAATPGLWTPWIEQDPEVGTHIGMVDDSDSPHTVFHPAYTNFDDATANAKGGE